MLRCLLHKIFSTKALCITALLGMLPIAAPAQADLVLNTLGDTTLIDFQSYTGAGLQPGGGAGTLDSDDFRLILSNDPLDSSSSIVTSFGGTVVGGQLGRGTSTGGVSAEGVYAFDTGGGNVALGFQLLEGTDFPGAGVDLLIANNTGITVDHLRVTYDLWFLNNTDNFTDNELQFLDGPNFYDPTLVESPEIADAVPSWVKSEETFDLFMPITDFGGTISDLANGESMDVYWSFTGFGSVANGHDEVAIDNIRITPFSTSVPEPSALLLGALGLLGLLQRRKS